MKKNSPKEIALKASVIATLIISVLIWAATKIFDIVATTNFYLFLLISVFTTSFVIFYYSIELFIHSKIKSIYRTINSLKLDKKKSKKLKMKTDVLGAVNTEVVNWAESKSKEINRLKETEIYRKEFIGNLSHELKTPIFSIQGYILTLLEGAMDDPDVAQKFLKKASKNVERMTTLVEDLDELIKLESSGLKIHSTKFDIISCIQDVMEDVEYAARKKEINIDFKLLNAEPIWVTADKHKIEQVITNLLTNSIHYGTEKGATKIDIHDMDKKIMVEISDNGIGIKKDALPRIFERFYRVDKSRTKHEGGSGIGLAIVKHIIEAHQQTINVSSKHGEGTVFSFTLDK